MNANPQVDSESVRRIFLWLCLTVLPLLTSCAGTTMREHFGSYNAAYAEAQNEQMLLNLARLQNGHPAYYLAIGAINDRVTVSEQAGVGNTGSFTSSKNTVAPAGTVTRLFQSVFGYNANGTVTRSSSPDFQFIPLNNDAVSKQVLQPILPEVFYTLYQQGYPIDQLMRVMIERVETTLPDNRELILVNSPTGGTTESYAKFLRVCAILRELQLRGCLSLQATNQPPEDIGPISFGGQKGGDSSGPALKDYSDAQDKGWRLISSTNGTWHLGQKRETPIFILNTDVVAAVQLSANPPSAVKQIVSESLAKFNLTDSRL
ncbi:MAG TPA: hypothetical protein VN516_03475, partial [Candidatus Baltobacteraceae bacterium]|nr:hypothetical protein [Candidatus Baltobacteraceae bacterium]